MRRIIRHLLTAGVLLAMPRFAGAQRLIGVVRDGAIGQPLPGAVVSLIGNGGAVLANTVTDRTGSFRMTVTSAAKIARVRRIGFLPRDVPVPEAARTGDATISVTLDRLAALLQPVISEAVGCPNPQGRGQALALWEQAQLGFLATIVARDANDAHTRVLSYTRRVHNGSVLEQTVELHEDTTGRPVASAYPPELYAQRGYAVVTPTGPEFQGPDADVLLHESFRETHCFDLAKADRDHPNQIGIAITPAAGRESLVEISGTLWLDQTPLALRELDFRYVAGDAAWRSPEPGGRIVFRAADNGIVLVTQWDLRLPENTTVPEQRRGGNEPAWRALTTSSGNPVMHVEGGELLSASWPDGSSMVRPLSTVIGTVTQNGQPAANVSVVFVNGPYRARTGADGSFVLHQVLAGPYTVTALDSAWDSARLARAGTAVVDVAEGDETQPFKLSVHPMAPEVTARCSAKDGGGGPAAMIGKVQDLNHKGVAATLQVRTAAIGSLGTITFPVTVPPSGEFRVCGVFPGTVSITTPGRLGSASELRVQVPGPVVVGGVTILVVRPPSP